MFELGMLIQFPLQPDEYRFDLITWTDVFLHRPLLPGTCHSTELILLPLMIGPLHLEAVRLIDLNSNETIDIRDLPDIIACEKLYS
jgi:hypothetical protein